MPIRVPEALRSAVRVRPSGWRLRNAPGGVWSLFVPVGWVIVLVISAALNTVFLILIVISQMTWDSMLVHIFGGLAAFAIGVPTAIGGAKLGWTAIRFAFGFHRLDLRLNADPPKVVAAGWVRRSAVPVADLTGVVVRQYDYGERRELVLRAGNRTVVFPTTVVGSLHYADPQVLAGWLGEILAPWAYAVEEYAGRARDSAVTE